MADKRDEDPLRYGTPDERAKIAAFWNLVSHELTDKDATELRKAIAEPWDRWTVESVLVQFLRSHPRKFERGAIKEVSRKAASLVGKAEELRTDVRRLAEGLHDVTEGGMNLRAYGLHDTVSRALAELQSVALAAAALEEAREAFLPPGPRKRTTARQRCAREMYAVLGGHGLDDETIWTVAGGAIVIVEGLDPNADRGWLEVIRKEVSRDFREWVTEAERPTDRGQ